MPPQAAMKKQPVLYLTYDGLSDPLGQSQVLPYLTGLSKKGWNITVISFEKRDRLKAEKNRIKQVCSEYDIDWIPMIYHKSPPVISTLYDLKKLRSEVREIVKSKNPFLIHCRSYLPMLVAMKFQKKGIKVLFDIRGFWADERVEGQIWDIKNPFYKPIYRYFKKKEKMFFQKADAIVSLTRAAIPFINNHKSRAIISIIPTSTDIHHFNRLKIDKRNSKALKQDLNLSGKFILGYSGSLGTWYLFDEMMFFFSRLLRKKPKSRFLIVTRDSDEIVYKMAKKHSVSPDKFIIRNASRDEMPLYLSIMDFSVFFIKPTFSKLASSPTKTGELMAMGVPMICNTGVGDLEEIIPTYQAGIILNKLDSGSFDWAVDKMFDNQDPCFKMEKMLRGAEDYYNLEKGVSTYDTIYGRLLKTISVT